MRYHLMLCSVCFCSILAADDPAPDGWKFVSARPEIRPTATWNRQGGPDRTGAFVIAADDRNGLAGSWNRTFSVRGGHHYRFTAKRRATNVDLVRRAGVARLLWQNSSGRSVTHDEPSYASYRPGERPRAEPEFPPDRNTRAGWTEVSSTYRAPSEATQVLVELHFRWGPPNSTIEWSDVRLEPVDAPPTRIVRLATVHHRPATGKTPQEKREQFLPLHR